MKRQIMCAPLFAIKDFVLLLLLAAALTVGLAQARAQEAPADSSANVANTAACAVDAEANDGDLSDEWLDPLRRGPDGQLARYS